MTKKQQWRVVFTEKDMGTLHMHYQLYSSEKKANKEADDWTKRNPNRYSAKIYPPDSKETGWFPSK